nr:immunoglobulin light chain junction region [Macaca mulatta]
DYYCLIWHDIAWVF